MAILIQTKSRPVDHFTTTLAYLNFSQKLRILLWGHPYAKRFAKMPQSADNIVPYGFKKSDNFGNLAMSDSKVRGTVHLIEETKTYGQKGFRKRVVVLEQEKGSFTNYLPLEFTRDSCDSVDQLNLGDEIEVDYQLSGRKWQRDAQSEVKYFLSAEATGFRLVAGGDGPVAKTSQSPNDAFSEAAQDDDAPF